MPEGCSRRARSALAVASASPASASLRLARVWSRSARKVSLCKRARTCPFLTRSPTFTRTSSVRNPPASAPITASCQAAMLPLAERSKGHSLGTACVTETVNAALAGLAAGASEAAIACGGSVANAATSRAIAGINAGSLRQEKVFMSGSFSGACRRTWGLGWQGRKKRGLNAARRGCRIRSLQQVCWCIGTMAGWCNALCLLHPARLLRRTDVGCNERSALHH